MRTVIASVAAFALGVAGVLFVIANPFHWSLVARAGTAVSRAAATAPATAPAAPKRKILYWRAPMDPTYIRDKPGKSPMGMDLIPVYADEAAGPPPPGTVRIDPGFVQNIGVQTEPVARTDIPFTIRTVATFSYDDRQAVLVNTKYDGWIEKVYVNYVGQAVRRGEKLFEIYSPQLVTTQHEYLQALDYAKQLAGSGYPDAAARARGLVEAARQRLRYWDISDDQVAALERTRQVRRTLTVTSPAGGIVAEKQDVALEGMFVKAGLNLYKLVNLSTIWAQAEVYENQVPWLRVGQRAVIDVPYEPGRRYVGRVRYILPSLDNKTRTLKASIELPNPGERLRADMYANVTFDTPAARHVLAVPEEAVIQTGTRNIVVVSKGSGTFQVRQVELGVNGSGLWEVKNGLDEGDLVVVSAQFLIDSESNLKEAIRQIAGPGSQAGAPPSPDHPR